jgi:hypothetical protein
MEQLEVFISSTQKDLQAERDRAEDVIADLGHDCLRAETFSAPGVSPEEACREMASRCDIYIGIFGSRYGDKMPGPGCSATEMEYLEARARNPGKVLVYLKNTSSVDDEQQRFLSEVQNFSRGYFRHKRFENTEELAEQIRRDVPNWITQRVREALAKEVDIRALRAKVANQSAIMGHYGIPEELR